MARMTDKLGNSVATGDTVVFIAPGYRMLATGEVIKETKEMIVISYVNDWNFPEGHRSTLRQRPKQVISISALN